MTADECLEKPSRLARCIATDEEIRASSFKIDVQRRFRPVTVDSGSKDVTIGRSGVLGEHTVVPVNQVADEAGPSRF